MIIIWSLVLCTIFETAHSFSYKIPLFFDIPYQLQFLIPKTESLIRYKLEAYNFKIDYQIQLFHISALPVDLEDPYIVCLDFAPVESYFITPWSRKLVIYQTDLFIAYNKMDEFMADLIVDKFLKPEIELWSNEHHPDPVAVELEPVLDIMVTVRSEHDYKWDTKLFQELFIPVLNELMDLVYLKINFEYVYTEFNSSVIDLTELQSEFTYDELRFIIYLSTHELSFKNNDGDDQIITGSDIILPKMGGLQLVQLEHELQELEQIRILELLMGQLFRLLGFKSLNEIKSPFLRKDFMIRRLLYENYAKLKDEDRLVVDDMINDYSWSSALQYSREKYVY